MIQKFISGSNLKLLAIIFMTIDHVACFLYPNDWLDITLVNIGSRNINIYFLMRAIGRMAFPIFSFLIVEGFIHTSNRFKYGKNLLIFALLSEIPWNLVHQNTIYFPTQNIFFTLFLGYLCINAIELYNNNKFKLSITLVSLLIISILLKADYRCTGIGIIMLMYILRTNRILMSIIGTCLLPSKWIGGLSFIFINLYNGKRGFVKNTIIKYSFYLFYPIHLLIIWIIKFHI